MLWAAFSSALQDTSTTANGPPFCYTLILTSMFWGYFLMGVRKLSVSFHLVSSFASNIQCSFFFFSSLLHSIFKRIISFIYFVNYFVYACILHFFFLVFFCKEEELIVNIETCGEKKGDEPSWLHINGLLYSCMLLVPVISQKSSLDKYLLYF